MGKAYECGRDVVVNLWEAVKLWRLAAEHGGVDAQFNLGVCYYKGTGVEEDLEEAVKWYRLAAERGHKYAKKKVLEVERRIEKENKKESHPKRITLSKIL